MVSDAERRLAAIMYTDIVGYTALTQSNEAQAMQVLDRHNRLLRPFFPRFHGREVKAMGDSFLVEFDSALDALKCAIEIQSYLHDYNVSSKEEWKIKLRIGVHLGDVIHQRGDVFGDAVNIASRIYPLAEPEGVCVSDQVFGQVRNKISYPLEKMAPQSLKNVQFPVDVYRVTMPWEQQPTRAEAVAFPSDRLAILPFANMSPDPNDEYFADGITDEIITTASGISGLKVISRTSVMGYKGTTKKLKDIGRELEVGSVLEGSFKKAGSKIRVTAQLIDVASDAHLWAQNYDKNLDDVFEVQSDIAKQVADTLKVKILSPEMNRIEKKPTENTTAYVLYLRGRHLWNKRSPEYINKAMEYFNLAIKEDPRFALAYVGSADCQQILMDWEAIDLKEGDVNARSQLSTALMIDDGLAEAHASLGGLLQFEWNWSGAEAEFKRAIALNPNYATGHHWYANLLDTLGRTDEAMKQITIAQSLDPISPQIGVVYGMLLTRLGRFEEGIEQAKKTLGLEPNFVPAHMFLGETYTLLSMVENGLAEFRKAQELAPKFIWPRCFIAYASALRGDREEAKRFIAGIEVTPETSSSPSAYVAAVYYALGDSEKAYSLMKRSIEERSPEILGVLTFPFFRDIMANLKFKQLLETIFRGV